MYAWRVREGAVAEGAVVSGRARPGRPPAMTEEQVRHARDLLARPGNTVTSIAKLLGVSRNTIYNYMPELKGGRLALAEASSAPELPQPARSKD